MRKSTLKNNNKFNIAILDDEVGIIDSISVVLTHMGYNYQGFTNQREAIENIRKGSFDLLILDYMMDGMHGHEVVEEIRTFNKELYVLLLTGYKDIAPPIETLKNLDIQGYCEKSDKFDQLILLIESGIKTISQHRVIKKYKDGFNTILNAIPHIHKLQPLANTLEVALKGITPITYVENAFILIEDASDYENGGNCSIFRGMGKYDVNIEQFMQMLNPTLIEHIGYVRATGSKYYINNECIYPLYNERGNIIGVIYVDGNRYEEEEKLLEIYVRQIAASISNAFLHSMINTKNEELYTTYKSLKVRYIDIIEALRLTVDAKDSNTLGHSDRVSYYAVIIGKTMGLSAEQLEYLRLGGIFHDIGKIGISDDILCRTEKLDSNEYDALKTHAVKGAHILSAVSMFSQVVPIVKYHHERMDGEGYPEGLRGDEIPLLARIVAVADAFDAIIVAGHFKSAQNIEDTIYHLTAATGTYFDPEIVDAFVSALKEKPSIIRDNI